MCGKWRSPQDRDLSLGPGVAAVAMQSFALAHKNEKNCNERLFATVLRKGRGRKGVKRKGASDSPIMQQGSSNADSQICKNLALHTFDQPFLAMVQREGGEELSNNTENIYIICFILSHVSLDHPLFLLCRTT